MIISVFVPVLEKSYEFRIDESVKVRYVIDEIIDIISKSEGDFEEEEASTAWLVSSQTHRTLSPDLSLNENQVKDADMLLLI